MKKKSAKKKKITRDELVDLLLKQAARQTLICEECDREFPSAEVFEPSYFAACFCSRECHDVAVRRGGRIRDGGGAMFAFTWQLDEMVAKSKDEDVR